MFLCKDLILNFICEVISFSQTTNQLSQKAFNMNLLNKRFTNVQKTLTLEKGFVPVFIARSLVLLERKELFKSNYLNLKVNLKEESKQK